MEIAKTRKPLSAALSVCIVALVFASGSALKASAASYAVTTGSYTITPASTYNSNMNTYDNSQTETIAVTFDQAVTVDTTYANSDFTVALNGATLANNTASDPVLYKVVADPSSSSKADIVLYANASIDVYPGSSMSGNFFAIKTGKVSITPVNSDKTLDGITTTSNGESAYWGLDLSNLVVKTGFELNTVSSSSATSSTPASVSYNCGSYAAVRGISWLRLAVANGGTTTYVPVTSTNPAMNAWPVLSGVTGSFALHCHDFENSTNDYYMSKIYSAMTSGYTGFGNYTISYTGGVLTVTQNAGTYTSGDTLSLQVYYSPNV
ncbi:hypothetical protein [Ethanoligenens harbinense]|uniref:SbsA Ig-like domain-containing protein n=1 Tax=Ethanoligenens harbinense (strain DSM 18485 / JCM 12961 / CGMCC 1.5033 / YUAN-3) TaxID=663278 RepID=E6U3X0_ETHHY|nr:hypothetical protein [Ethanoligenens harbinense]ADU26537.1 hypothetical protein Ethha_0984 [Ethanoligenens harbinense YUAN-3]AVQ95663.1 hypothetical protein CXQ68_05100 [Ethanoligenens harbinense YUAN-3]AYF38326.1 hypothetical protein CXP51_04960 [Ethanoligenens harbinense]AYF41071.1 hypothetical protein CN246_05090 [Ethanoligenens harbinense]QCN91902.1 hypothetical protein DRA42_05115 [Ethanoligenens harbinense]